MKEIVIISFTDQGSRLNARLNGILSELGYRCEGYTVERYAEKYGLGVKPEDFNGFIGENWGKTAFVFIGASGIAIRYIAPWLADKFTDSPVVSMDEKGQFVISLIAGHVGGGNKLADEIAHAVGGTAVITTATDVQGKFAVDVFAKENGLKITDRQMAKEISAAILDGIAVGFYSDYQVDGDVPQEIKVAASLEELHNFPYGIAVLKQENRRSAEAETVTGKESETHAKRNGKVLYLEGSSQDIVLGIGCRKGVPLEQIEQELEEVLTEHGLKRERIKMITSIDVKENEPGICGLAGKYRIPFVTFSAEELKQIETVSVSSAFVEQTVGVDNVCERAALLASGCGELIQPKTCKNQVTFALAKKKERKLKWSPS